MNKLKTKVLILTFFCLMLLFIRFILSDSKAYLFLAWNLFLAFVPLMISSYLISQVKHYSKYKLITISGLWLIFLPNSPYVITDFVHLASIHTTFIWLDILLLFSYSFTCLLFGLISINHMLYIFQQKWSNKIVNILLVLTCLSCGFGIYIGRVLRFNSWSILTSPFSIIKKCLLSYTDATLWVMTFGFGSFLFILIKFYSFPSTKSCK